VAIENELWPVAGVPQPISGYGTTRDRLARELRESILTGRLRSGARIDLDAVAAEYNTSRTPVREACLELTHDGLVQIAPRRGIVVVGVTPDTILENFSLMAALLGIAAEWAAERITPDELNRVRELKVEVAVSARAGDDAAVANWLFHREVNKACKSQRLLAMLGMAGRMIPHSLLGIFPERTSTSLDEHDQLVRALSRRDGAAAREVTENHLKEAAARLHNELEKTDWAHTGRDP
jgi:DNA-binding GntR family transcriptional regulator